MSPPRGGDADGSSSAWASIKTPLGRGPLRATNSLRGTVLRIDPATSCVTATIADRKDASATSPSVTARSGRTVPLCRPGGCCIRRLDSGRWTAWNLFRAPVAGRVLHGGEGKANYIIVSDLPLQGGGAFPHPADERGDRRTLRQRRFRAGPYRVAYQSCDDSNARGSFDRASACERQGVCGNRDVLGVVGPFNAGCAFEQMAILNRAREGPLAMVSPTTTAQDLTLPAPSAPPIWSGGCIRPGRGTSFVSSPPTAPRAPRTRCSRAGSG